MVNSNKEEFKFTKNKKVVKVSQTLTIMKNPINLSYKKIKAKLAYVNTILIKGIVVNYNNCSIQYRNDGLRTGKAQDDFLEFICNSSILGRNITKIGIERRFHYLKMEWVICMDVSNEISEFSNISPDIIELMYNSFSSKNGKQQYGNHTG